MTNIATSPKNSTKFKWYLLVIRTPRTFWVLKRWFKDGVELNQFSYIPREIGPN